MPSLPVLTRQIAGALWSGLVDRESTLARKAWLVGGFVAPGLRLAAGMTVGRLGPRPERPMVLWDFEACPHCRIVREALSTLDLDAEIRPCPKGGTRFRGELEGRGVPRLHDPNAGVTLVESRVIVAHLYDRYGAGRPPWLLNLPPVKGLTGVAFRVLTAGRGRQARPSVAPAKPLELWSFEASPYCRAVRSTLTELELPYSLHNVAKDSPRRPAFLARAGKMQMPWFVDPNTGVEMYESLHIERYLEQTYGRPR